MSIVRATGFEPIGRPVRNGQTYVLRALDPYDLHVHVVVDARSGRIVSVGEAAPRSAAPAGYRPAPMYDPYDAPVYGRIFGPADDGYAPARPPGNVPGVKPHPKVTAAAPMPRPRPYVRDATGSIDTPASHDSAPPPAQKNPEPPKDNGITLPPVAPLD